MPQPTPRRFNADALPDMTPEMLAVAPLARAETIPSRWYTDPRMLDFEQATMLRQTWHYVGHASQLPGPGHFLRADVAGEPLVVVRGKDEKVRAFYNVCRHRGGPLATEDRGCARMLQCQYHGWTYTLDGTLRGVPRFDCTELFDKRDYGLVPVEVAAWDGLLFVRLEAGGPSLDALLDGIAERIAPLHLGGLRFHGRVAYDVACNWKVYVDNYLEGYHLPLVHPDLCKTLDVRAYVTETFAYHSLQHSPLRDGDGNPYGDGEAFYYFAFPNTMLNILPGRLQVNSVLPTGPASCRVLFDYVYADLDTPAAQQRIAEDLAFSDAVQQEDIDVCEHVQRGLASAGYDRGRFSVECERGVYHFQTLLKAAYAAALGV
ncbi:MAG: aromatic ring-hydroxylating dioxygenase subunit alpha [Bacteroidota bacterium]